ncbi:MAG: right-handed parallel beta-helix repeat-containing protein [Phycisphaerales bacterium]
MRRRTTLIVLLSALGAHGPAFAGPLTPPAGPIAPTPGEEPRIPLTQATTPGNASAVFVINQPGSYYLEGNVAPIGLQSGVQVEAEHVTLDLNGFTIDGVGGGQHGVSGPFAHGLVVRNGVIRNMTSDGVYLPFSDRVRVESIRVENCAGGGVSLGADGAIIDSVASGCDFSGFSAGDGATMVACRSIANGTGFATGAAMMVDCLASLNSTNGFRTTARATFERCTAADNGENGFSLLDGGRMTACESRGNTVGYLFFGDTDATECSALNSSLQGFNITSTTTRLTECASIGNGSDGVRGQTDPQTGQGARLSMIRCTVERNLGGGVYLPSGYAVPIRESTFTENNGYGVLFDIGTIEDCVLTLHLADAVRTLNQGAEMVTIRNNRILGTFAQGIWADGPALVEGNVVESVFENGIVVRTGSVVRGNTVRNAHLSGPPATGDGAIKTLDGDNRIEGNTTYGNGGGANGAADIRYLFDRNIIVGNTLYDGTISSYGVNSNTLIGPINDLSSPSTNLQR